MSPGHEYKHGLSLTPDHSPPPPASGRAGGRRLVFWAVIAVLLVGAASYWLTRTPQDRRELRKEAAAYVNSLLEDTPLAGLGRIVDDTPPPPPQVLNPPTEAGTLSGRTITGTIAAPMDFGPVMPRANEPEPPAQKSLTAEIADATRQVATMFGVDKPGEQVVFQRGVVPPATEDSRLKPGYVASLAQWLAKRYKPGPRGGSLNVGIQSLNQECGIRLASRTQGGRSGLLRYAFHPAMIGGLYRLYIDRFMEDLQTAAREYGFDARQNREFHMALAGRAALFASALSGAVQIPDLPGRLARVDALGQKVVDTNAELTTALSELDEQRQRDAPRQSVQAAQLRVNGATSRYRRATDDYRKAQNELAGEIRQQAGPGLDEESLLFIAAWAGRRQADGGDATAALNVCIQTLHNLADRCRTAASE